MKQSFWFGAAYLVAMAFLVSPARAGNLEGLGGWEGDSRDQGYGFVGVGWLVPKGKTVLFPVRLAASYLYYQYDSTSASIRVRSPGVEARGGVRFFGSKGSVSALAGVEVRREHRETLLAGEPERSETITGLVAGLDGDLAFSHRWHGFLFGNYSGAAQYLYGRGALRYQINNQEWRGLQTFFVGVEGVRQGNDESDAFQGGGFLECNFVPQHASLSLHAGHKESWSPGMPHETGGYLGLSLYRRF